MFTPKEQKEKELRALLKDRSISIRDFLFEIFDRQTKLDKRLSDLESLMSHNRNDITSVGNKLREFKKYVG